ncbi:AAA family ATPase [Rhizobium multihospitium]|uniref:Adenylate kinase n=1 Tax=Rhizobium multihospitium TaxID=410764 RepID=A0A1C3XCA3_9HYPH|nr:AAA family ATPase [Rhizobium multihospitium]SCB49927.1 Adenylate kinase [Rhizobium multihospitium]
MENLQRILIFGNGGTGKTWLSREIGQILKRPAIHLDDLRWAPDQYGVARDNQVVFNEVVEAAKAESWLMEGVYGWLANAVLHRVTSLIWIDLPDEDCIANITARGIQGGGSEESFQELIEWVREYRKRENSSTSYVGHQKLFEACAGTKVLLKSRSQVIDHVEAIRALCG